MSRPTSIEHPLAQLRIIIGLGRQQLAAMIDVSRVMLEKIERRERPFGPLWVERVFRETGVCPGWLESGNGPIHACDGHPYTAEEFARWRAWRDLPAPTPKDSLAPGQYGFGGRHFGKHYQRTCCPRPGRIMTWGPMDLPPDGRVSAGAIGLLQAQGANAHLNRLAESLIDLARGAVIAAMKDRKTAETRLLKAMAGIRKHFPEAVGKPDPHDFEFLQGAMNPARLDEERARQGPKP